MRYLVTGGAGFIGSNLVDRLVQDGHDVTVIDNESSDAHKQFYWNDRAKNYKYDINDYVMVRKLFEHQDAVFHLAAEARIQPCIEDPLKAVEANVMGTATVLECARKCGVKRVILSSTSAIYGLKNNAPMSENQPSDCLNPYSTSKLGAEELCKMYSSLYGLETLIFRYFNVYGERQPVRGQYAPVVGIFMRQKQNGSPMTIVGDGEQRRDFVHVSDVVNANICAANFVKPEYDVKETGGCKTYRNWGWGRIYNVGTGKDYSVKQIAEMIGGESVHIPARQGEARITRANIDAIKSELGWTPKVKLEEWIQQHTKKKEMS
jgi:UDP-glucose 4-epimerase